MKNKIEAAAEPSTQVSLSAAGNQTNIEQAVMRRVNRIHRLRFVVNGFTASGFVLLLALWGVGREVWVAHVFENMPHSGDLFAVSQFYLSAFLGTEFVVQALSLAIFASLIYLARETAHLVERAFVPARV